MQNQIEQKLDSREVAEMMEMEHPKLLRKIDDINEDFRKSKIGFSKYWQESSYQVVGQTRNYRCFLITKRGCEFLAHKTTGTKGNLFTDRYMDRFEQMKTQLSQPIELGNQMLNLAQGTQIMAQVVQGMLGTVNNLQVFVQDSIQAKDKQIDDMANLVGIRSKNRCDLIQLVKNTLIKKYNLSHINSSMEIYKKAKSKIFKEFNVYKWEDIPATKYFSVQAFIEECI